MIRKIADGHYRLYSKMKDPKTGRLRVLGTFRSLAAAQRRERELQHFRKAS